MMVVTVMVIFWVFSSYSHSQWIQVDIFLSIECVKLTQCMCKCFISVYREIKKKDCQKYRIKYDVTHVRIYFTRIFKNFLHTHTDNSSIYICIHFIVVLLDSFDSAPWMIGVGCSKILNLVVHT